MKTIGKRKLKIGKFTGFTLIELLVVISIIGVLAAFTIPVLKAAKAAQYKKVAQGELERIETALENYKAKYGAYPPGNVKDPMMSQLYYELSGTTITKIGSTDYFVTLDGSSKIPVNPPGSVSEAYGVGGFENCTKGDADEDSTRAQNFLPGLKQNQFHTGVTNNSWGFNVPDTAMLITSVGGPDDTYKPLGASGLNPFRYNSSNPTNNPGAYDLWVDLCINGKTNRISNWSRQAQIVN